MDRRQFLRTAAYAGAVSAAPGLIVPRTGKAACGLTGNLALIAAMPSKSFISVHDNLPSALPEAQDYMWRAWMRSAYNPNNRSLYRHGSGHATGLSNAVIRFDLETGVWSTVAGANSRPGETSGHTYDAWMHVPGTNEIMMANSGANDGLQPWTWMFDCDTNTWEQLGDLPGTAHTTWGSPSTIWHTPSSKVIRIGPERINHFNQSTRQWSEESTIARSHFFDKTCVYDPVRNVIWGFTFHDGGPAPQDPRLNKWTLNSSGDLTASAYDVAVSGDTEILEWEGVGADYDTANDKIILYAQGNEVYEMDPAPATPTFTKHTIAGLHPGNVEYTYIRGMNSTATAPPAGQQYHGHYGGFEYIAEFGVFIVSMGRNSGVYVYKH